MNERIQELAVMANPSSKEIYEADNWQYNCAAWDSNNLTKFAELIVRECAEICMKEFDTGLLMAPQAPWIAKQIREHFGVEL